MKETYITEMFKGDAKTSFSTLSPNGNFYYKIQNPSDLYWGLFCTPVAFYDNKDNLIYHKNNFYAQCSIDPDRDWWTIVSYSKSGNYAYFIERNSTQTFFNVLLDLTNRKIFRKEYTEIKASDEHVYRKLCKDNFDDNIVNEIGLEKFTNIVTDELKFEFKSIFGQTDWRP